MEDIDIIRFPRYWTRQEHLAYVRQVEEEYENPPMSDDPQERLQNAIVFVQDRKWSYQKAADKAGVTKSAIQRYVFFFLPLSVFFDYIIVSFCRALKAVKEGRTPGVRGPAPMLTNEELLDVRKQIDENTLRLNAPKSNQVVQKMIIEKSSKTKVNNTYAREGIIEENILSKSTYYRYKNLMGLCARGGEVKLSKEVMEM